MVIPLKMVLIGIDPYPFREEKNIQMKPPPASNPSRTRSHFGPWERDLVDVVVVVVKLQALEEFELEDADWSDWSDWSPVFLPRSLPGAGIQPSKYGIYHDLRLQKLGLKPWKKDEKIVGIKNMETK